MDLYHSAALELQMELNTDIDYSLENSLPFIRELRSRDIAADS